MSEMSLYDEMHDDYEKNMQVIKMHSQGKTPQEIHSATGIPLRIQKQVREEFSKFVQSDAYSQKRAKETVAYLNTHFEELNRRLYDLLGEAENDGDLKLQREVLKQIADTESMKVKTLQQAGLISQNGLGEELAEMERRQQIIIDLLKDVRKKYPEAAKYIEQRLRDIQ